MHMYVVIHTYNQNHSMILGGYLQWCVMQGNHFLREKHVHLIPHLTMKAQHLHHTPAVAILRYTCSYCKSVYQTTSDH